MKYIAGIAVLLLCGGCTDRSVTFEFYPHVADTAAFPKIARQECAKYGMAAAFVGSNSDDFGRLKITYQCEPK